ncbi:MAG: cytochrome c peroxidase [Salibacteraceae bacterium]|jgi:cytochrome c peroxidase
MFPTNKIQLYRDVYIGITLLVILSLNSCKKDVTSNTSEEVIAENVILSEYLNLPNWPFNYEEKKIPTFLEVEQINTHDNTPVTNPITNNGATLGRVLFYDNNLSQNNTISCASCHHQANGFSDTLVLSVGFEGGKTGRHSMGLSNARYRENGRFFWDERAETLEDQVLEPIQDSIEMGMNLNDLELKLQMQPYYPVLFKRAFGDSMVSAHHISLALAQFVRSMISFNSRFDQGRAAHKLEEPFSNFTPQENQGKEIFHSLDKGMCFSCHFTEAMVTENARNNGLTREPSDIGLEAVTGNWIDKGKFKAPSLRNIAVRAPYMHNGGYRDLKSVINAYSTGISWTSTLDAHFMMPGNQSAIKFNLSEEEKEALEAFLHTLTDEEFLTNEIYADPFKK